MLTKLFFVYNQVSDQEITFYKRKNMGEIEHDDKSTLKQRWQETEILSQTDT